MPPVAEPAPPAPPHGNVLRLGVAHATYRRVLDAFVADGTDLLLAGHTHGGQLRVPGIGALVTNCDLPRKQARGLSDWHGVPLHVSAGMGASPYSDLPPVHPSRGDVAHFARPEVRAGGPEHSEPLLKLLLGAPLRWASPGCSAAW
ncbi:hypothetical protein [Brachybacterium sacelli]|uniref:hypothetical protein n=1 Tax=Brachybacterium sacelli TaxID=173364 RepID=UPI00361AEE44